MMKKIFVLAVALMMVAGMAYAEDRLSLSGEFFVRGWDQEGYASKYSYSYDDDDEDSWFEQRLRIGGTIAVADDVSVGFRFDVGEGVWGLDYTTGSVARPGNGNPNRLNTKIDFDRAFVKIVKDTWELTAGQQFMGIGVAQVYDANAVGFNFAYKFNDMMKLSLLYNKQNENGSTDDDDLFDDVDHYVANFGYTADAFKFDVFYIMQKDGTPTEAEPWIVGISGSTSLGMVNLKGEFAHFGGDADIAGGIDFVGDQLFLAADAQVTEMFKLGAEFFYAMGSDELDEIQITTAADWDTFTPMGYNTPESGFISGMPTFDVFAPFAVGGVVGATVFADVTIMEGLTAGAKFGFFEVEDDEFIDGDLTTYNAWIKYMIATNTYVSATYLVSDPDVDGVDSDEATALIGRLAVNF